MKQFENSEVKGLLCHHMFGYVSSVILRDVYLFKT